MVTKNRIRIASLITGIAGGAIGSFWIYLSSLEPLTGIRFPALLIAFVISGFSCFCVSRWYLNFVVEKDWQRAFLFGSLFACLAGVISGGVTGFIYTLAFGSLSHIPVTAGVGAVIGILTGVVYWILSVCIYSIYKAIRANNQKTRVKIVKSYGKNNSGAKSPPLY